MKASRTLSFVFFLAALVLEAPAHASGAAAPAAGPCTVTVKHGPGGDVTPASAAVDCGSTAVLAVLPLQQYYIANIQEGGRKSGPIVARTHTYTTTPVTKRANVSVTFSPYPTVAATASSGGSIAPSGATKVEPRSTQRFVVTPAAGYMTGSVKVDGKTATPVPGTPGAYDVPVDFKNRKISAAFTPASYTVTGRVEGNGGKITPAAATAGYGKTQKFTVTADKTHDFTIRSVTVNGEPRPDLPHNATSYSFSLQVTGDTTVVATFFGKDGSVTPVSSEYVVLAWNDLGMHCLNPAYDVAVILPPYNTVWAQVIRRGNPPRLVTEGLTLDYRIVNNTSSADKGFFGQFWQYAGKLFGASPQPNFGLNLEDPGISNGLTGRMIVKGDHFQVNGIPVVPIDDQGVKNPYQVIEVTVKDATGKAVAVTRTTIPTSDEINCASCHGESADPGVTFTNILQKHDLRSGTNLLADTPLLCASCHGSPALGIPGPGSSGMTLSQAVHGFHATVSDRPACYDCHPGERARCNRSVQHTAADGNCTTCHGSLAEVAATIASGSRIPWVNEPKCATCHLPVPGVDTGSTLYRNSAGHGGIYCAACHGSPHAMAPSTEPTDNAQAIALQGAALPLGSCAVCHRSNRGGGNDFADEHAGKKRSACNVCHTGFLAAQDFTKWPHRFQWKAR